MRRNARTAQSKTRSYAGVRGRSSNADHTVVTVSGTCLRSSVSIAWSGSVAVTADPDRPTVQLDRGGTADVLVEYAATDDPTHERSVHNAVERSRLGGRPHGLLHFLAARRLVEIELFG